ncbi:hypothetical protein K439DRAFT_1395053 [Ramaria rubella]|nr:hypothetical protein K439DRAFT_1395053 [Ramaria rubella]
MTSTISTWYHNQYSSWNRTRRMQASPYLARQDTPATRLTRAATEGQGNDAVINMGDLLPPQTDRTQNGDKKKQDTLFGPSIGIVSPGPEWADQKPEQSEKAQLQDVLTPELVKSWVEKSKEASQPTTTLQALVNLKRPSLRLSPISQDEPEDTEHSHPHQHGLEFQFDCDAPKCGISLHIISSTKEAPSSSSAQLVDVFHTVVDGGFGRVLKLEEGATLELDKYDPAAQPAALRHAETHTPSETPAASAPTPPAAGPPAENASQQKKRFTLRIRKRTHPHAAEDANRVSIAGPALQVVDVETPATDAPAHEKEAKEKDEGGVRVLIRLEALDVNEHTLVSPNSQATYLHIVRLGPAPTAPAADTRPWVVRVVKREATIGPHTFHLHEIYGLTSHGPAQAPAPTPATYPPTTSVGGMEDDPTSECLLCLSSPREVVLLPCRHLVACKECAVNMVEFGAGGQVVHAEDPPTDVTTGNENGVAEGGEAANPGETSGAGAGGENGTAPVAAAAPAPTVAPAPVPAPSRPRRKRKAKGWFCPVCRQPYTSLLRISTTAPGKKLLESDNIPVSVTGTATPTAGGQRPGFLRAISNAAARVTGTESPREESTLPV